MLEDTNSLDAVHKVNGKVQEEPQAEANPRHQGDDYGQNYSIVMGIAFLK